MNHLPALWKPGVSQGPASHLAGTEKVQLSQLSQAVKLSDLVEQYHFYTPGVLHTVFPAAPDTFAAFLEETGLSIVQTALSFDHVLLQGMHEPWSHTLYFMSKASWPYYQAYMGTVAMKTGEGHIYRVRRQELQMIDPLQPNPRVTVPVTAFVLESNQGSSYFKPIKVDNVTVGWRLEFDPNMKFRDHQRFTAAFNDEASDPYGESDESES